jgi:hypothetical protein
MKYRIKIITYKNGRKEYFAQFKSFPFWKGIGCDGTDSWAFDGICPSKERALERIEQHNAGSSKVQTIEFEYINNGKN